jgi:transcriptional regulator with XRE-family HTH domain
MSIQKMRLKKGWSQQQLAEMSGLSTRTVQRIEAGAPPSLETLKSLAAVFEVDIQDLQPEAEMNGVTNQTELEEKLAFDHVRKLRGFYLHVVQFVVINAVFLLGNYLLVPEHFTAPIVTLCWGVGLAIHALKVWKFDGVWERTQVERRLGRSL